MFEIAIDTGGTFTDAVLQDEEKKINVAKFPTDKLDPSTGIMGCIGILAEERGITPEKLIKKTRNLVIGTTLSTNVITERNGAKCCLIHTKGFKDILEISRRIPKQDTYDLRVPPPSTLVPRYLRFGVEERLQYDGQVVTPLNQEDVKTALQKAKSYDVEVPIICFLHSYINPDHEEAVAEIIKKEYPNAVLSSHILQTRLEGYRFHTSVLAAYVKPVLANFVETLEERFNKLNFSGALLFITCSGGVADPQICMANPSLTIGSGPAAGPLFACKLGELAGLENIVSVDIGGTTVDLSILPKRKIETTTEMVIADHRKGTETVDVLSIGVGGGALAKVDDRGMIRVGPDSAGSNPGPACYNKGGDKPTLTDANVVLGYIPTDYFLGGKIVLEKDKAWKAIEEHVAKPLKIDVLEAAHSISRLAEENISKDIFLNFVKKGYDPREFALVMGGGAGAVHAAKIAKNLNITDIYIPKHAALFCPVGILLADYKHILSQFYHRSGNEIDALSIKKVFNSLEKEGIKILKKQGIQKEDIRLIRGAGIRYYGQLHDIEVLLPEISIGERFTEDKLKELIDGFHQRHETIYGRSNPGMPVTMETIKLHAIGKRPSLKLIKGKLSKPDASSALKRERPVFFEETGVVDTRCYDGDLLRPGNVISGPVIVEETKTTIVVPPEYTLNVDAYLNYVLRRN